MTRRPGEVVIVGGGFGGLYAARQFRKAPASLGVTVIDRRNFHLFQPLLYQVATGGLSPANIAAPIRAVLKRQANCRVILAEVTDFDLAARRVRLADGEVPYDYLIIAAGSRHHYFGHDEWERLAPGLKTIEDATEIRRRFLLAFEQAERATDEAERRRWLTFVVVGGGPTGVELAGAMRELAHDTLRHNFRSFDPDLARIILVEGTDRVLPPYPPPLSARARAALERLGVAVMTDAQVTDVEPDSVTLCVGNETQRIETRTVFWGAGVLASPLAGALARASGAKFDRSGRVIVEPDLTLPGHPEVFVIGDMAHFGHQGGQPLPAVARVAMQQGKYAARRILERHRAQMAGTPPPKAKPFRYFDLGTMATIGRNAAVADLRGLYLWGFLAWLVWLFVHLLFLIQFQNRLLVLFQWAWNYWTRNRAARLITGVGSAPRDGVHASSSTRQPEARAP